VTIRREVLEWRPVRFSDGLLDFGKLSGTIPKDGCALFAVSYIRAKESVSDLHLLVGSESHAKIYLNGLPAYSHYGPRPLNPDQDQARPDIQLDRGINVITLKLIGKTNALRASVRIADHADQPVAGLSK
jgi:hypothetical protein